MAAISKVRVLGGGFAKRFVGQIWGVLDPALLVAGSPASVSSRNRGVHVTSYDKNEEEQVQPNVLPDHAIDSKSDKYWGPHPATGVFGPAEETGASPTAAGGAKAETGGSSALDQKVWYRPLEDVDRTPHA